MPVTPSGKIARRKLPEPAWERSDEDTYVAPRDETEQALADIWAGVLDIEQVGIHDDFFELGGHSLLATQVISHHQGSQFHEVTVDTYLPTTEHTIVIVNNDDEPPPVDVPQV